MLYKVTSGCRGKRVAPADVSYLYLFLSAIPDMCSTSTSHGTLRNTSTGSGGRVARGKCPSDEVYHRLESPVFIRIIERGLNCSLTLCVTYNGHCLERTLSIKDTNF